jgi:hypothetical protein
MKRIMLVILFSLLASLNTFSKDTSVITLTPKDAILEGSVRTGDSFESLGWWRYPKDKIRYTIPELDEGKYKVTIKYSVQAGYGGQASIKLNDRTFKKRFEDTGGWGKPDEKRLGYIDHEGGELNVILSILEQNYENNTLMNVYTLTLEKK